jgi:hypothetical protein
MPLTTPVRFMGVLFSSALFSSVAIAQSSTFALTPSLDNTIFAESGTLSNGQDAWAFVGATAGGQVRRALLEFDLSSVPAGSIVTSASLSITMDRAIGPTVAVDLHRVLTEWGEGASNASGGGGGDQAQAGDATWTHRIFPGQTWATPGGDFVATPTATTQVGAPDVYTWDSTPQLLADLQLWLDTPALNHGWIMIGAETTARSAKRFFSGEAVDADVRPLLTLQVTPIPEPAIMMSMAVGIGILGCMTRRRA